MIVYHSGISAEIDHSYFAGWMMALNASLQIPIFNCVYVNSDNQMKGFIEYVINRSSCLVAFAVVISVTPCSEFKFLPVIWRSGAPRLILCVPIAK